MDTQNEHKIYVIGAGPGAPELLTPAARKILDRSRFVAGGRNVLGLAPAGAETHQIGYPLEDTRSFIEAGLASDDVCVLTSGDPGCFSILPFLQEHFRGRIRVEPGISAVQLLAARLCLTWDRWRLVSLHGRGTGPADISLEGDTVFFCDDARRPQDVARLLLEQVEEAGAAVGARLGSPREQVWQGSLLEAAAGDFPGSALLLVRPVPVAGGGQAPAAGRPVLGHNRQRPAAPGIPDDFWFRRPGVPLSKSEFRAVLLSRAQPAGRRVIWDIGAGTGSYGIECSLLEPRARVIAFDHNPEACALITENAARFAAHVEVVCAAAPGCLEDLAAPDLVIIGGSDGRLEAIFNKVMEKLNPGGRLVVTAVLAETRKLAHRLFGSSGLEGRQAIKVEIARGEGHRWQELNPVILFTGDNYGRITGDKADE